MIEVTGIQGVSLFDGLTREELEVIAQAMTEDTFPEGHVVYRENDTGCACIYIIQKGKVDVVKRGTDGDPMPIAVLKNGNFFGEFSFFDGKPHSATTIVAEHGTIVLSLQRPDFEKTIEHNPMVGYKILINIIHEISSVIRKMNESYIDMTGYMFGRMR